MDITHRNWDAGRLFWRSVIWENSEEDRRAGGGLKMMRTRRSHATCARIIHARDRVVTMYVASHATRLLYYRKVLWVLTAIYIFPAQSVPMYDKWRNSKINFKIDFRLLSFKFTDLSLIIFRYFGLEGKTIFYWELCAFEIEIKFNKKMRTRCAS